LHATRFLGVFAGASGRGAPSARIGRGAPPSPTNLEAMPVREAILRRLGAVLNGGGLEALERMSARDLKTLMLHVLGRRMDATTPLEALRAHERLAALRWAPIDARRLREIEAHAFDAASAFEAIALPPLVPLGATRALGGVSPDHVLATARGVEVLAPLAHAFPDVRFAFEVGRLEGLGYYTGPCLKVSARVGEARFPLADGGVLDWTARLLNDDKEIFVTSGTGLDIVARARPR